MSRLVLGRRLQRALVFLSIASVAIVVAVTVGFDGRDGQADALTSATPFPCGAADTSATSYGNRQPVQEWNGNMSSPGYPATTYPCLSGVGLTLNIPANGGSNGAAQISSLNIDNDIPGHTMKLANGSTIGNVYHLGFLGFDIDPSETGASLTTSSGTATPYTLTLTPAHGATLGGNNVVTDLLVDGSSTITIQNMPAYIPIILDTCALLGGTGGSTCTVSVNNISSSLVTLASDIGISTFQIKSMNLKIYYLSTHSTSGGNPGSGVASLQFPNTTITVGGS